MYGLCVDLNPIRARMAATPEGSDYTGIQRRIQARQEQRKAAALLATVPKSATTTSKASKATSPEPLDLIHARERVQQGEEHGLWITPCRSATGGHCSLDDYLQLVDHTGRFLHNGKRGQIPAHLAPILERLQIDIDTWLSVMLGHGRFLGSAVGAVVDLVAEAARRVTGLRA